MMMMMMMVVMMMMVMKYVNVFVCRGHKTGKLAVAENRGILKICSCGK